MSSVRNKKVVYTAIFGGYDGLIPQPKMSGFDFICFTDNENLNASPWHVKVIEPPIENDSVRSSRYIKINPHLFLRQYDISIFIDGNYLIVGDLNKLIKRYLEGFSMACFSHGNYVGNVRNTVEEERIAILKLAVQKEKLQREIPAIERQMDFYSTVKFPDNCGLIHSAVLLRKHNDPALIKVMEDWWYMVKNFSRRDQLSFNYAAWKNSFKYNIIKGDTTKRNGFVLRLGSHRKDWKRKYIKTKIKLFFGIIR